MDSNLPTGGFAHSYGLEAAVQMGQFHLQGGGGSGDEEARIAGLLVFARQTVQQQAMLLLPLVRAAYTAAESAEAATFDSSSPLSSPSLVTAWANLDRQCHALLTTEGGRRASVSQGQALLRLACDNFPTISPQHRQWLLSARDQVRGRPPAATAGGSEGMNEAVSPPPLLPVKGHQAPLFGWLCRALGVDVDTTSRMFCYLVLRDLMAAATRLGLVGPLQAVRLQMSLYQDAEAAVMRCLEEGGRERGGGPRQDNPLLDILQGAHEKLYSRLFIS
jgi:urease accessory protein